MHRGHTYRQVLANLDTAGTANLCLYMAVNRVNVDDLDFVARLAATLPG